MLYKLLTKQATIYGDKTAIVDESRSISFAHLFSKASATAAHLQAQGCSAGIRSSLEYHRPRIFTWLFLPLPLWDLSYYQCFRRAAFRNLSSIENRKLPSVIRHFWSKPSGTAARCLFACPGAGTGDSK